MVCIHCSLITLVDNCLFAYSLVISLIIKHCFLFRHWQSSMHWQLFLAPKFVMEVSLVFLWFTYSESCFIVSFILNFFQIEVLIKLKLCVLQLVLFFSPYPCVSITSMCKWFNDFCRNEINIFNVSLYLFKAKFFQGK